MRLINEPENRFRALSLVEAFGLDPDTSAMAIPVFQGQCVEQSGKAPQNPARPGLMRLLRALAKFALVFSAVPAYAAEPVTVTQLLSTQTTPARQPIMLPQRDVQLVVSRFVIAPGAALPTHMHPCQRYGYLLARHLKVTLTETGQAFDYKPGDFIVEVSNVWHSGTVVGNEPAVLLVIDQVEAGHRNTLLQDAQ